MGKCNMYKNIAFSCFFQFSIYFSGKTLYNVFVKLCHYK